MDFIYLVRQISICNKYSAFYENEQAVFDSYELADDYMSSKLIDRNPDGDDLMRVRNEILQYPINKADGHSSKRWIFDINGNLLKEIDYSKKNLNDFAQFDYEQKFSVGDLVCILPQVEVHDSPEIEKEYGVVIEIPVDKLEWIKEGNKKEDWSGTYVVFYIDDKDGLADHQHVPEVALRRTNVGSLPDELFFLQEYSDHLKGIKQPQKNYQTT